MTTVQKFNQSVAKDLKRFGELRPGYTVRVHQLIKEGKKERIQVFEGMIIGKKGKEPVNATITVRKISSGVGVERIFPLLSPLITKIEVIKKAKVRRAKLYHMRKLSGKAARLKEQRVSSKEQVGAEEIPAKVETKVADSVEAAQVKAPEDKQEPKEKRKEAEAEKSDKSPEQDKAEDGHEAGTEPEEKQSE